MIFQFPVVLRAGIIDSLVRFQRLFDYFLSIILLSMSGVSDVSRFATPRIYTQILANSWGPRDLPIPTDAGVARKDRIVSKFQNSLHIDSPSAQSIRQVYGYIGHIGKLTKSSNTGPPFLLTVVSKLCFNAKKDFARLTDLDLLSRR